eukprot:TRINITY_DN1349_c0_g1_i3.p1 TRINITY_DN1349_c0_g1~~TRINITY_DN1349_c0_g1_i3.p1  ORF type:complete len:608 (+),score=166.57 TRINITY_DN1349_c0_g1_i3:210-1826(+)
MSFCINQCGRHGECLHGCCECDNGWYGIDCSIPSKFTATSSAQPWLPTTPRPGTKNVTDAAEEDLQANEDDDEDEKGVAEAVRQVRGSDVRQLRPLIYIYDLPAKYTFNLLEGRKWKPLCATRVYDMKNATSFVTNVYGNEVDMLEGLLTSAHRTNLAEEADYFYVPVLGACLFGRTDDSPRFSLNKYHMNRAYFVSRMYLRAYKHIKSTLPYWNRRGGRDHIWMFPWDEGSCHAPLAIQSSILLTPWGNTMAPHNYSTTKKPADNWERIPVKIRGRYHPCYEPEKDIVIPSRKIAILRYWARPLEDRPNLFYFRGQLGKDFPHGRPEENYSLRIRQRVAEYFSSVENTLGMKGKKAEAGVIVTNGPSDKYEEELSMSRFCGVFPGDGFSARMEDSILQGCIPVIIQDGIHLPYENVLQYDAFALRLQEADIPDMVDIIKAIPFEDAKRMQEAVQKIWQRWTYYTVLQQEGERQRQLHGEMPDWAVEVGKLKGDDAIATVIQILHYKLYNDKWRREAAAEEGRNATQLPTSCSRPAAA